MSRATRSPVPAIEVAPRPDGRWAVRKEGTSRASRVLEQKADAVGSARAQARREGADLIVKDAEGQVERRATNVRDPRRRVG